MMDSSNEVRVINKSIKWRIGLILICWLSMFGFDFFLHAGLLTKLYVRPSSFLLPAEEAFLNQMVEILGITIDGRTKGRPCKREN